MHMRIIIVVVASLLGFPIDPGCLASGESVPAAAGFAWAAAAPAAVQPAQPPPRVDRFGDALPDGALARFGTVRLRQGFHLHRVLFSPDGKKLALAGCGRPVGLWDVATGKELHQFRVNNNQPSGIAFSPDGSLLAEGDSEVRLWNTITGALARQLPSVQASQRAVVFAKDGKLLISGGHDKVIHLWDPATGAAVGKLEGHTGSVLTLAVTTLASGGDDKSIRLWDLGTKKLLRELKGHDAYLTMLSFSPDGRLLASAGDEPICRVWDVATGKERFRLRHKDEVVRAVSFSPDGKLIATGHGDGAVRLWDSASGKQLRHWGSPSPVMNLDFAPDGKTLATISALECGPRLWDVAGGTEIRPSEGHRSLVAQLRLVPNGNKLLSLGRDQQVLSWDPQTGVSKVLLRLRLPGLPLGTWRQYCNELSPNGLVLAMGSAADRTVRLVDPETQKPLRALTCDVAPRYLRFSPDGKTLAIGCEQGACLLWSWNADAKPSKIAAPEKDTVRIFCFAPDGSLLVTASENAQNDLIHIWEVRTGKRLVSLPGNNRHPNAAFSPDGKWAAVTLLNERVVRIFDVTRRSDFRTIPLARAAGELAFSPDGLVLAVGEDLRAGAIHLLDFATGQPLLSFRGHHSGVVQLVFSPDGRSLFSGGGDSTILHWDASGRQGKRSAHANLGAAWDALAGDPRSAYLARWDFLDAPDKAVALLRDRLPPAKVLDAERFHKFVDALGSGIFREREQATAAIKALGPAAEALLRKEIKAGQTLEVKRRLQALHDSLLQSPDWQRSQRSIMILAALPPNIAGPLVQDLARGDADAMLTQQARSLLKRWRQ